MKSKAAREEITKYMHIPCLYCCHFVTLMSFYILKKSSKYSICMLMIIHCKSNFCSKVTLVGMVEALLLQ